MKIQQFSQQGKRSNNEDCLGITAGLLTVCDGMGGHNFGERASAFVKEAMTQVFVSPRPLTKMDIQQELNKVQTDLNNLLEKEPELEKMGTTFTGVFFTPDVWYAAHIGDSRIYLFRPSEKKLWHTWDHSLVGELMRTKEITVEAGRFHPMSNRIAKAIIAKREGKISSASIVKIDQLKKGDIFLLCSDGVVEGWGDYELVKLFSDKSLSFEQKCKKLSEQCNEKSKDNNTAIIAEVEESDVINYGNNDELEWTTFAEVEADYNQYLKDNADDEEETPQPIAPKPADTPLVINPTPKAPAPQSPKPSSKKTKSNNGKGILAAALALIVILGLGLYFFLRPTPIEDDEDTIAFNECQTVDDYRTYIRYFGQVSKHYAEAKHFVDSVVADSIAKENEWLAEQARQRELRAYERCTNIKACDRYLEEYPDGVYVQDVLQKKADLEQQLSELKKNMKNRRNNEKLQIAMLLGEDVDQFEDADNVDDETFVDNTDEDDALANCNTIEGCEYYLRTFPNGNYVDQVKDRKTKLVEQKEDEAYKNCTTIEACNKYLKNYPNGRYVDEVKAKKVELEERDAFDKCNSIKACEIYLQKYPKGQYVDEVKAKKAQLEKEKEKEKQAELEAYQKCLKENTLDAYNQYLKDYPNGFYVNEVKAKINELPKDQHVIDNNPVPSDSNESTDNPNGQINGNSTPPGKPDSKDPNTDKPASTTQQNGNDQTIPPKKTNDQPN